MKETLLLVTLLCAGLTTHAGDWPEFRGPQGDGHAPAGNVPLTWSETNNVKWKTEIHDRGWSTPVVFGGQTWLTTATPDGHDFFVMGVDAVTGKILHDKKLFHCDNPEPLGNNVNGYASPSPAIEPGRVYVHFGSYGTACLDTTDGRVLWQRTDLPCRHYRGPASSVVLFENLVLLTMDGADVQYLVALDKQTGKTIWKTDRTTKWGDEQAKLTSKMARDGDLRKAHSTPLLVEVNGVWQMFSPGAKAAFAYDPRTGRELWHVRYPQSWSSSPRPVYAQGMAFFVTGFGKTDLYAVRADGHGDVTDTRLAWQVEQDVCKTASPIVVDDLLYMVGDNGVCTCLEVCTGKPVWRERLPGNYAASPVLAGGRLYFCNQQGKTTVLQPGRTFTVLATNTLNVGCMASPAVSGDAIILRSKTHLYRIE